MCVCSSKNHEAGMTSAAGAPAPTPPLPWEPALRGRGLDRGQDPYQDCGHGWRQDGGQDWSQDPCQGRCQEREQDQGQDQVPCRDPCPPGRSGRVLATVLLWLLTGTGMSSLNKWIFSVHGFRYPLLLSALHMLAAALVGCPLAVRRARSPLPARAWRRVLLLSLTFCATMACGNLGLTYAHLDLAQTVYTTTPLFTLALSTAILGKRHHPLQYAAMGPICLGAACSIMGEMHFQHAGCSFLLAATFLRGLKSVQQSVLLQEERLDSIALLHLMSLPSFCLLLGAALVLEGGSVGLAPAPSDHHLWLLILLSCLLSVLYNLASFSLLALTSALTVHVLGNFHVVGNLALSWLLFGSRLSSLSYVGIVLTLVGMFLYHNCHSVASWWTQWWTGRVVRAL